MNPCLSEGISVQAEEICIQCRPLVAASFLFLFQFRLTLNKTTRYLPKYGYPNSQFAELT